MRFTFGSCNNCCQEAAKIAALLSPFSGSYSQQLILRFLQVYHGEAVNPWNLSTFERWLGHGRTYDRARDEEDRSAVALAQRLAHPHLL